MLGAIISSTDAAAVFLVLRSKNVSLKGTLTPLLELESGSNDPMAVFLTVAMTSVCFRAARSRSMGCWVLSLLQMGLGGVCGFAFGKLYSYIANRIRPASQGIYPVFTLAFAVLTYSFTAVLRR